MGAGGGGGAGERRGRVPKMDKKSCLRLHVCEIMLLSFKNVLLE